MRPPAARGFTLIEMVITVGIMATLLGLAAPFIAQYRRSAELTAATAEMVSSIAAARSEAMKRGASAMVSARSGGWNSGWDLFVDLDRDNALSSGDFVVSQVQLASPFLVLSGTSGSASASQPYLLFDASGFARVINGGYGASTLTVARTDVTGSDLLRNTRRVKVSAAGLVRVCTPISSADAGCAADGD